MNTMGERPAQKVLAASVAVSLIRLDGRNWQIDRGWKGEGEVLRGPGGRRLHFHFAEDGRRVSMHGGLPAIPGAPHVPSKQITVSTSRPPGELARDIDRRLLPVYESEWKRWQTLRVAQVQRQRQTLALAEQIGATLAAPVQDTAGHLHVHRRAPGKDQGSVQFEINSPSSVRVTIDTTSPALAEAIAHALTRLWKQDRTPRSRPSQ